MPQPVFAPKLRLPHIPRFALAFGVSDVRKTAPNEKGGFPVIPAAEQEYKLEASFVAVKFLKKLIPYRCILILLSLHRI